MISKISKIVWLAGGILLIALIIGAIILMNLVASDIRNVTSQMTIQDLRKSLDIMELSQQNKSSELLNVKRPEATIQGYVNSYEWDGMYSTVVLDNGAQIKIPEYKQIGTGNLVKYEFRLYKNHWDVTEVQTMKVEK